MYQKLRDNAQAKFDKDGVGYGDALTFQGKLVNKLLQVEKTLEKCKKYIDMFNANIWLDDNLVVDGELHKYYSILPRVEIYIRYLNCVTSYQHYNQIINRKDYNPDYPINYLDNTGYLHF